MKYLVALAVCLLLWVSTEAQHVDSCGHTMAPVEIGFLLDSTHSIKEENWPVMTQFIKDLAWRVNYGQDGTRFGAIQWSRKSWEMMSLDQHPNEQMLLWALDQIPFRRGGGQLHKALDMLVDQTLSQNVSRDGAARIGILVIDEQSHQPDLTQIAAQRVRNDGIKMIVIGVERRRFDYNELVGIAGGNSTVLIVDSIMDLDTPEFLEQLMALICAEADLASGAQGSGADTDQPAHACPANKQDQWKAPSRWTAGPPVYYQDFETEDGMVLHRGAHLAPGMVGNAATMDKTQEQYVELGNVSCHACLVSPKTCGTVGGTVSLLYKITSGHGIISSRDHNRATGFDILYYSPGWNRYRVVSDNEWDRYEANSPSGWIHAVIVFHGVRKNFDFYENGVKNNGQFTHFEGTYPVSEGNLVIGRAFASDDNEYDIYSDLQLDELLFWDKPLTEAEVRQLETSYAPVP